MITLWNSLDGKYWPTNSLLMKRRHTIYAMLVDKNMWSKELWDTHFTLKTLKIDEENDLSRAIKTIVGMGTSLNNLKLQIMMSCRRRFIHGWDLYMLHKSNHDDKVTSHATPRAPYINVP